MLNNESEKLLVTAHKGINKKGMYNWNKGIWLWNLDFGVLCDWQHFSKILKHVCDHNSVTGWYYKQLSLNVVFDIQRLSFIVILQVHFVSGALLAKIM